MELEKPCMCECHEKGKDIIHFVECCKLCYEKYIVDGKLNKNMHRIAIAKMHRGRSEIKYFMPCYDPNKVLEITHYKRKKS